MIKISHQNQKGVVFIITFLILGVLLLLGSYFLTFTLTESKISKSQEAGARAYYLTEAGINEAIWKLKNDDTTADGDAAWKSDFINPGKNPYPDGTYWTATFSRSFGTGSYTVTIQNSILARGEIISISTVPLPGGKTAQRVVKTTAFKALAGPTEDGAFFSGGSSENINIKYSRLRVNEGNVFSNHNLDIKGGSTVEVYDNLDTTDILEGQTLVVSNLSKSSNSTLITEAICAKDTCTEECAGYPPETGGCPPDLISLPLVDFDSPNPDSFKSRAQTFQILGQCEVLCNGVLCDNECVYSASEFEDLLWQVGEGGVLILNNVITYITGNIELKGGRHLIVNGALVVDDNVNIGKRYSWSREERKDEGFSQITINRPTAESPSGLLTKRKIDFGLYSSFQPVSIVGIIYANDETRIVSVPESFNVLGGIIGRKLALTSVWEWLNITLDNDIILYGLGYKIDGRIVEPNLAFSPIITIEHWEESY